MMRTLVWDDMRNAVARHWPLIAMASFAAALSFSYRSTYLVNDNLGVLDHALNGTPARFVGVLFSGLLWVLYHVVSATVPWYGLIVVTLNVVALACIVRVLQRCFGFGWIGATVILTVSTFHGIFLLALDYTATSILLTCAGWVVITFQLFSNDSRSNTAIHAGVLLAIGYLLRDNGAVGGTIMCAPLLVLAAARILQKGWHGTRAIIPSVLVFLLPVSLCWATDQAYFAWFASAAESRYVLFDQERGELHKASIELRDKLRADPELLNAAGFSKEDEEAFQGWLFFDERVFTVKSLAMLNEASRTYAKGGEVSVEGASKFVGENKLHVLFLLLCALVVYTRTRSPPGFAYALFASFVVIAAFVLLRADAKVAYRTAWPLLEAAGIANLVGVAGWVRVSPVGRDRTVGWLSVLTAILLLVLAISMAAKVRPIIKLRDFLAHRYERIIDYVNREYNGAIFVMQPGSGLRREYQSPYRENVVEFKVIQLGWSTLSPLFYSQIGLIGAQHGHEIPAALARRRDAYLLGKAMWALAFVNFANRHGTSRYQLRQIESIPKTSFNVYRLVDVSDGLEPESG